MQSDLANKSLTANKLMPQNNDNLYLQAAMELRSGLRDEALWAKAFALENGDEKSAQAYYIRFRVEALEANDHQSTRSTAPNKIPGCSNGKRWSKLLLLIPLVLVIVGLFSFRKNQPESPQVAPWERPSVKPANAIPSDLDLQLNGIEVDKANKTIAISGEIRPSTAQLINSIFLDGEAFPKGELFTVFLDSNGGDLYAAMEIGRTIRNRGNSAVAVMNNAKCYSSCVFILAGGGQRIRQGSIGIHRPYLSKPSGNEQQLAAWFAKLSVDAKAYLREMRVRDSLFDDMVSIAPADIHIFESTTEMDKYGLMSIDPVVEEKIAASTMKRLGISRQEFLARQNIIKQVCTEDFSFRGRSYSYGDCYNKFMSGELTIQPN